MVDWESPLWLSINEQGYEGLLCLRGRYLDSPYVNYDKSLPSLNLTECHGPNILQTHLYVMSNFFRRPTGIPDERVFTDPIWSTWAQFKEDVNQTKVN